MDNDEQDAKRYRWLRDRLHCAVGAGVEVYSVAAGIDVNDAALVYEPVEPEKAVRVFWYPDTPVGFYEIFGPTLDEAIDKAISIDKDGGFK